MQIIPATESHISLIREVAHATWPVTYGSLLSEKQLAYMLGMFYTPEALRRQMEQGQQFFVAMEGDRCLGFASV